MSEPTVNMPSDVSASAPPQLNRPAGRTTRFCGMAIRWVRLVGSALLAVVVLGGTAAVFVYFDRPPKSQAAAPSESTSPVARARLVGPDTLQLPADVARSLDIKALPAKEATRSRRIPPFNGSLALDPDFLARVHSRFAGEVVEIGTLADSDGTTERVVRFGDHVEKGQLLAVVWCKDLGEKKSELVDALSQLRINRDTLNRLKNLSEGVVAQRQLREAERAAESSLVAVVRAEATLRTWRVSEEEIAAVVAEADRLGKEDARPDVNTVRRWARVEVRAPLAGTVVEKNTVIGDIVDTSAELFKIAELSRLCVWAHVYEEDLPALLALPKPVRWTVRLKADPQAPPLTGTIENVGALIDPNQHTALVLGRIDNSGGRMRAGQFVTATVEEPPPAGEVEIPTTALLEDGIDSIVIVQEDPARPVYAQRRVVVTARFHDVVHVRVRGTEASTDQAKVGLAPGELVVVSGAVLLKGALEDLQGAPSTVGTKE